MRRVVHLAVKSQCGQRVELVMDEVGHDNRLQVTESVVVQLVLFATREDDIGWLWNKLPFNSYTIQSFLQLVHLQGEYVYILNTT